MKNIVLGAMALIVFSGTVPGAKADSGSTTVQFTVPASDIGVPIVDQPIALFSSALDGTAVAGQSLSLNLTFSNQVLASLDFSHPESVGALVEVFTNAGAFPGFAGPTTGFLLGPNGNQFGAPQVAGRSDGNDGSFAAGLDSFTSANSGGVDTADISGAHFDIIFPNTGYVVTNVEFLLGSDSIKFGTAQQLPEPSTLGLTVMGLFSVLGLAVLRRGV